MNNYKYNLEEKYFRWPLKIQQKNVQKLQIKDAREALKYFYSLIHNCIKHTLPNLFLWLSNEIRTISIHNYYLFNSNFKMLIASHICH